MHNHDNGTLKRYGITVVGIALPVCQMPAEEALAQGCTAMSLPRLDESLSDDEVDRMMANATRATEFLKALAHEGRLMILCHLASGERSVTELEQLLAQRQAAVSQQLSRLRLEGLVKGRRQGKTIYYRLADERTRAMLEVVYDLFCKDDSADLPKAD